jgi:hypothetical protein
VDTESSVRVAGLIVTVATGLVVFAGRALDLWERIRSPRRRPPRSPATLPPQR